ncbi:DUF4229 domain-containing protein [Microbacterium sediminis]|uniref:Uncharacterized protein n=1 Tax=Microbacterium sediminis TaxID=904291 RepID=A0A1B9ND84_9MICO|nr:DUF4229 domain-containing protein [Microbacterium sediminis]OCG74561.1 hypothetical protein A7J15_03210 [Microbacterium sediminis]QBR74860.1 DUF4229 domain-containing protein [Microbacterium sediminis]
MKFVVYALLRLAFFLVPFGLMMLLPVFQQLWWLAAIFAAMIGLSLSILLLRKPLAEVSSDLYAARQAKRSATAREREDALEDEANEAAIRDQREG